MFRRALQKPLSVVETLIKQKQNHYDAIAEINSKLYIIQPVAKGKDKALIDDLMPRVEDGKLVHKMIQCPFNDHK